MFRAILAKIPALAALVTLTLAAILFTLAAPAYADCHYDKEGPFWIDEYGRTNLHELADLYGVSDRVAVLARAQDLLSRGANPNVIDKFGNTPLVEAARSNFLKMASLLIANGAILNTRSPIGNSPLDWAYVYDHTQMQALLRAHGGKRGRDL